MNDTVFRSVKRVCYAGLDSVTLREEVAERISRAVHFDAHCFGTADPDTGLLTHVVARGAPVALFTTYSHWLYPMYAAIGFIDAHRAERILVHLEEEYPQLRDAMMSNGMTDAAHVVLSAGGGLWGKWCLMREHAPFDRNSGEDALLERLAPHIARGLRAAALIDQGAAAGPAATAPGVLVLDARGRITLRTPTLVPMLDDLKDVGFETAGAVPLAVHNLVANVRRRLASAERGDSPANGTVRARGRSGRWYTLRASLAEPDPQGDCAAVIVIRPVGPREMAPILTRLYGLSRREREVAAALARGESTKRIAARFAISPHTVKEHVERACAKIGVSGRRALVARLYFDAYAPRTTEPV